MSMIEMTGMPEEMAKVENYISEYLAVGERSHALRDIIYDQLSSKGKRLRPMLVLLAGSLGSNSPEVRDRLCRLGALVEMVHMASLIHDDIVDDSPLRRGHLSVQAKYGKDMAVYAGDFVLSRIVQVLFRERFEESGLLLAQTVEDMCWGEIGQFASRFDIHTTIEEYQEHIFGKTVSICELACRIGAMEAGCDPQIVDRLRLIGRNFGYMFQIRDDLLDFVSDEKKEGKKVHQDICEGIYTLPVLYAWRQPAYRSAMEELLKKFELGVHTAVDIEKLGAIVEEANGIRTTIYIMEQYRESAQRELKQLPESNGGRTLYRLLSMLTLPASHEQAGVRRHR